MRRVLPRPRQAYNSIIRTPLGEGGKALEASVGTVLAGRYRVRGTLGSGGMAVVYRAEDAVLGRAVAVKTLHRRYAEMPSFRRRFEQEARAMASLDHENIVKIYDISQDGEVPFIVAECVAGTDVGGLIAARRDGRLDEALVKDMAEQLLSALSYAHGRGIIHRDVKPSNILVAPGGTIKVADFGIARIVEEDDDFDEDEPGEIVGSARYMSPEQLRGEQATQRSDLYSVGILLYHCLTGKPPFSGDVRNLAKQHVHETPTPPRRLNRRVSPGMEAVILKALAKNPAHRYGSAAEMLDDMRGARDERATNAGATSHGKPRTARTAPRGDRWGRGKLVLASLAALLLLVGGGGALAAERGYLDMPALAGASGAGDTLGRATPVDTEGAPKTPDPVQNGETQDTRTQDTQGQGESSPQGPAREGVAQRQPVEENVRDAEAAAQEEDLVPVPEVTTFYDYYARQALADSGLEASFVYDYREGFAPRGVTWATEPAAGTRVPVGTTVTVFATPQDRPPLL